MNRGIYWKRIIFFNKQYLLRIQLQIKEFEILCFVALFFTFLNLNYHFNWFTKWLYYIKKLIFLLIKIMHTVD